jgi:hypothetical protein
MPFWRGGVVLISGIVGLALVATSGHSQGLSRVATTLEAIVRYPVFFHDKAIAVVGTPVPVAGGAQSGLPIEAPRSFVIAPRTGNPPERRLEFRGRLFDVGRFLSDDSRLGPLNLPAIIESVSPGRWPGRERLFVLTGGTWLDAPPDNDSSIRSIALTPSAFEGRSVTVRGRFRGRNLLGDLPAWPRESQWDFVLQAADAAIWVLGRRPRGSGFDLSTTTRSQTGQWLEVTGQVEIRDDLPVLIASAIRTAAAEDDVIDAPEPVAPPLPPPDVLFSAPTPNELAIARDVVVQFQFSRPMNASTFEGRVRVRYAKDPDMPVPSFTVSYRPAPMAMEIRFSAPLAPGADVVVELLEGMLAVDGVAFGGTTLRFTTSGLSTQARLDEAPHVLDDVVALRERLAGRGHGWPELDIHRHRPQ